MLFHLQQYSDVALLFLRVVIAAIFSYHALPKLKNPAAMAQGMGWPSAAVAALGTVEFFSAVGMFIGAYVQIAAILLIIVMLGAIKMKITNWGVPFSTNDKTGWEFDLVLFAVNVLFLIVGGGALSI